MQFWSMLLLASSTGTFVLHRVVAAAISFEGAAAWLMCAGISGTVALAWMATVRGVLPAAQPADALTVCTGPFSIRVFRGGAVAAVPVLAVLLVGAVAEFDWNFLLQKLGVLLVWSTAFGGAWAMAPLRPRLGISRPGPLALAALIVAGMGSVLPLSARDAVEPEGLAERAGVALDAYATSDPSFHLIRGLMRTNTGETAEFYSYLKAHATIGRVEIAPIDVSFTSGSSPSAAAPDIYLFIIDSLRPDYLSAYNRLVTTTPAIDALADDGVVFERAFTRYGATGLSVPSIWAGGMLIHKQYVKPFYPMNALEKLLDANGYQRFISQDHIVTQLFQRSPKLAFLDRGRREMDYTLCGTLDELQGVLASHSGGDPIFAMTRPLELHMANLAGGGTAAYAARVRQLDACLGRFVGFLKASGRYENSVIVLTSDHGESLGEEGRWGHAYTLFPEVIRIPLIVRLPAALRALFSADRQQVVFSTDLTPSLYALLGDAPRDRGPLYGAPLFVRQHDARVPRRGPYLLASSYGPVWGLMSDDGERLFIADAIEGREHAFARGAGGEWRRMTVTDGVRAAHRTAIRTQIGELASLYKFNPQP
jgi:hypothetical protein